MAETFALLVGIEKYTRPHWDLRGPCLDVGRICRFLVGSEVPGANIFVFVSPSDQSREKEGWVKEAEWMHAQGVRLQQSACHAEIEACWRKDLSDGPRLGSRLFVYWSGHGFTDKTDGTRVLLCSDYEESLPARVFAADVFLANLRREPFEKQVHLFDVCGNYAGLPAVFPREPAPDRSRVDQTAIFATGEGEYAKNHEQGGIFTDAALSVLQRVGLWGEGFADEVRSTCEATGQRPFRIDFKGSSAEFSLMPSDALKEVEAPTAGLPFDAPYVSRNADYITADLTNQDGVTIVLFAPHQFGKSSLLNRLIHAAQERERNVLTVEAAICFDRAALQTPEAFYQAFANALADGARIQRGSSQHSSMELTQWIERELLDRAPRPVVMAVEEGDKLIEPAFRDDVIWMLKTWNDLRGKTSGKQWRKLSVYLAMSRRWELAVSPDMRGVNIGHMLTIPAFDREELRTLYQVFGVPPTAPELDSLLHLLGGKPYLSRVAVSERVFSKKGSSEFFDWLRAETGPFGDHLRGIYRWLYLEEGLKASYRNVIQGRGCANPIDAEQLISEGLAKRELGGRVVASCGLYQNYFEGRL